MNKEEILRKISSDVDFIPTLEEYKLISNEDYSIGYSPIFALSLVNIKDKSQMDTIEKESAENRPSGLYELYCQLEMNGHCESYSEANIYYVAYTLATKKIDFIITGSEYKYKLKKKRKALLELKKQLEK